MRLFDLAVATKLAGGGGGGGSSDFSTASVTITNSTGFPLSVDGVFVVMDMLWVSVPVMTSSTVDAVLYKGAQEISVPDGTTATVTGQITEADGIITISGDGTITVS